MPLDYSILRVLLDEHVETIEKVRASTGRQPSLIPELDEPLKVVFSSVTQAMREALIGCVIVRIHDKQINIRKPYMSQGADAFNGRTLDERVVNPFLKDRVIPSSKGPCLDSLRTGMSSGWG